MNRWYGQTGNVWILWGQTLTDFVGTDPDGMEIPEGFRLIFEIKMG